MNLIRSIPTSSGASARFLVIGDPHFHVDRTDSTQRFCDSVLEFLETERVDAIICLGDVQHSFGTLYTPALNQFYAFAHRLRAIAPLFILVGNHDYINNQQFLTDAHWMNPMKEWTNVVIVDRGHTANMNGLRCVFVPYVPNGRIEEALDQIDADWRTADLVFGHQEIIGCKMGAITSTDGDVWPPTAPLLVSGHIHDRAFLPPNVFYTGSAMQHGFGENGRKSPVLLECAENMFSLYDIVSDKPRSFWTHTISPTTPPNEVIPTHIQPHDELRIIVECDSVHEFDAFSSGPAWKLIAARPHTKVQKNIRTDEKAKRNAEERFYSNIRTRFEEAMVEKHPNLLETYKALVDSMYVMRAKPMSAKPVKKRTKKTVIN